MIETELEITRLSSDGRGIACCGEGVHPGMAGMVVFVRRALPGQLVRAVITARKKNLAEGVAISVIRDNPVLLPPFCQQEAVCGGCPLQRFPYHEQLAARANLARDALIKFSRLDREFVEDIFEAPLPSPALLSCRNKMEFAFGNAPGSDEIVLGQRGAGSLDVIPVASCPLLPEGHAPLLASMQLAANSAKLPAWQPGNYRGTMRRGKGFWRHFTLRHEEESGAWVAICGTAACADARVKVRAIAEKLLALHKNLKGFVHEEYASDGLCRNNGKRIFALGETTLVQKIAGRPFRLDASSFSQVNPAVANALARLVLEMTEGEENGMLLDLYCGAGAPGLLLAPRFRGLLGIESHAESIALARENAAGLRGCRYMAAKAENFPHSRGRAWHTVLADPPRAGLGKITVARLLREKPRQIIYISCNPATFARDAAMLGEHYKLVRLASADMFPHTAHLECCSRWIRRDQL